MWPWRTTSTGSSVLSLGSTGNPDVLGTLNADTSEVSTALGWTNEELLVDDGGLSGTHPEVGSVFDVTNTPFGDFAIPTAFDASALALSLGDYFP